MSAKVYITVLLEYETPEQTPRFHARMEVLGGKVAMVSFSDVFEERDQLEKAIERVHDAITGAGLRWVRP